MEHLARAEEKVASREEVMDRLAQRGEEIRDLGVRRLRLFGSFARGDQGPESDVDVLVEFERGEKTYERFLRLATLLEACLGRPVELVTTESLSPYMGPRILAESRDVSFAA